MKFKISMLLFCLGMFNRAAAQYAGNALYFDGGVNEVTCSPIPPAFSNLATTDLTVEVWVNPQELYMERIFSSRSASLSPTCIVNLFIGFGNMFWDVNIGGVTYGVATTTYIPSDQWTHVAATWQAATHTVHVYFNGVSQPLASIELLHTVPTNTIRIGGSGTTSTHFRGILDEMRVWSEARTACQIQSNMNKSITGTQPNLLINYLFNEGVAGAANPGVTILPNVSDSLYDGTLENYSPFMPPGSSWVSSGATLTSSGNPAGTAGEWTGSTSTDYNTALNWCGEAVPTASTDILIPCGTPYEPHILSGNFGDARDISLAGGTLTVDNGGTLSLWGNLALSPTGTLAASGGTVYLSGSAAQSIATGFSAGNLIVSGGSNKSLNADVTVTGNLDLTSGNLVLNTSDLILSSGATLSGGSEFSYVKTNGAGSEMIRTVSAADGTVLFPVGSMNYNPVSIANAGTTDNFRVHVRDEVLDGGSSGSQVNATTTYAINHTWDIEEDVAGGSDATVSLQWQGGEENNPAFDYNHVYVAHYYAGQWHHDSYAYASDAPAALGIDPFYATLSGITSFSPFSIGSSGGATPLPLQLTDLNAVNEGARNKIDWHSAQENGLDHYEVERSHDGNHFSYMSSVAATGHASAYAVYDDQPNDGLTYYRLRLVYTEGTPQLSGIVHAFMKVGDHETVMVYPNPVTDNLSIQVYGTTNDTEATLRDMTGKVIMTAAIHDGRATLSTAGMAQGVYFLNVNSNGRSQTIKVVKD